MFVLSFFYNADKEKVITRSFDSPLDLNYFVVTNLDTITIPEVWVDIKGYDGKYKISNHGKLKSFAIRKSGVIIYPHIAKHDYLRIDLYSKPTKSIRYVKNSNRIKYMLHVLVAEHFCFNPDECLFDEVDHINRMTDDPEFWNLRWIDRSGNLEHRCMNEKIGEENNDKEYLPF